MAKGVYKEWLTFDKLNLLRGWARNGFTDEQIAKKIGISTPTLYVWKNKYTEIDKALKKGKEIIDNEVEEALIKSALGYYYDEEKMTIEERDGITTKKKTITKKYIPPDVMAIIYFLNNRRPWLYKNHRKSSAEIDKTIAETELTKLKTEILKTGGDSEELDKLDKIIDGLNKVASE